MTEEKQTKDRIIRKAMRFRLLPDKVDTYVDMHDNIWPDLVEAYQSAGVAPISCFLDGTDLVVTCTVDTEHPNRESLTNNAVERRWQDAMAELRDPEFDMVEYNEIFYMPTASE